MLNRQAVIVPLGMLLDNVDASHFIEHMLAIAKLENANFEFTAELEKMAFIASEKFNKGELKAIEFESEIYKILSIKKPVDSFWEEWNKIIAVNNLTNKVKLLQELNHNVNALFYLISDTNSMHIEQISATCELEKIPFTIKNKLMMIANIPLYTSFQLGKNRADLLKQVVAEIERKQINKCAETTILLGNPENIKNAKQQFLAKKECDEIVAWCNEKNISYVIAQKPLEETLLKMLTPIEQPTEAKRNTYSRIG